MLTVAMFARFEAKPGKEDEVASVLQQALALVNQETTTPLWFALRLGPASFALFDAFADETSRRSHAEGPVAGALRQHVPDLLTSPPTIERLEILGAKQPPPEH